MQATIIITVADSNDNSPIFSVPPDGYVAAIPENATVGTAVINVTATDIDQGSNQIVTYSISGTSTVPFAINSMVSFLAA